MLWGSCGHMSSLPNVQPVSPRLGYRRLATEHVDELHALGTDSHVRRFLLDGKVVERDWARDAAEISAQSFQRHGLGLWLLFERSAEGAAPIGLAGFWVFDELGPELQLVYALRKEHTGQGYATEAAAALVDFARAHAGIGEIPATVDEPNLASIRVLEKLGFVRCGHAAGAFGRILRFRLVCGRPPRQLRTERLVLRPPWHGSDVAAFAAMNADPRVMKYFPATLSGEQSAALAARIRRDFDAYGYGLWVVEAPGRARFIGIAGLARPRFEAHFTPCVEIGWRFVAEHWGRGYAPEAANAALCAAFVHAGLPEVVSFTAAINERSRRVMEKLGMRRDPLEDFDHPLLPEGHPLRRHVLHRISAGAWTRRTLG